MDLESTLIRAEALFRRFQRLVEAIDKKGNFPPPRLRKTPTTPTTSTSTESPTTGQSSSIDNDTSTTRDTGKGVDAQKDVQKVISPELRKLLSRKVDILPRETVAGKGDGFGSDRRKR
jgi:TBC1 domain family member 15